MILTTEIKQKIKDIFGYSYKYPMAFHVSLKNNQDFVSELEKYLEFYPEYCNVNFLIKCVCIDYQFRECEICHKPIPYLKRKNRFCSLACMHKSPDVQEKIYKALKRNLADPIKRAEIQNKMKATNLERYGVENILLSDKYRDKIKQTNLEKYGVENVFQSKEIQKRIKKTNLEKYGVEYPAQNKEIYAKVEQTNLKKYGHTNYLHSKIGDKKIKHAMIEKYGVEFAQQSEEIKNNTRKNNIENYGVTHPNFLKSWETILSWDEFVKPLFTLDDFKGYGYIYKFKCCKCGNVFTSNLHTSMFLKEFGTNFERCPRCENCFPCADSGTSNMEKDLQNFCKEFYPNLIENSYDIINPYEVDIYIPEIKLAIEFNGIFYHSLKYKPLGYHLMKTEMCEKLGIRLIHIWETDWHNNEEEIKQHLRDIFMNTEHIDLSQRLDRCWYMKKDIEGYECFIEPPEIIEKHYLHQSQIYQVENCGYLVYEKKK